MFEERLFGLKVKKYVERQIVGRCWCNGRVFQGFPEVFQGFPEGSKVSLLFMINLQMCSQVIITQWIYVCTFQVMLRQIWLNQPPKSWGSFSFFLFINFPGPTVEATFLSLVFNIYLVSNLSYPGSPSLVAPFWSGLFSCLALCSGEPVYISSSKDKRGRQGNDREQSVVLMMFELNSITLLVTVVTCYMFYAWPASR